MTEDKGQQLIKGLALECASTQVQLRIRRSTMDVLAHKVTLFVGRTLFCADHTNSHFITATVKTVFLELIKSFHRLLNNAKFFRL